MIDIAVACEGFQKHAINDISFVRSAQNIADGLTKPMKQIALRDMSLTATFLVNVEQWIVRPSHSDERRSNY